mmetsp:Transcript_28629/g.40991  ORF Transcript_28629/g.40991 Transcript_28629/m.40991 type:complete len:296 (+) Transcript_28629:614-1501(+)
MEYSYGQPQAMQLMELHRPTITLCTLPVPSTATNSNKESPYPQTCRKSSKEATSPILKKTILPNSKMPPPPSITTSRPIYPKTDLSKEQYPNGSPHVTNSSKILISPTDGTYLPFIPSTRMRVSQPSTISSPKRKKTSLTILLSGQEEHNMQKKCTTHGNKCFNTSHPQKASPFQNVCGTTNISTSTRNNKATSGEVSLTKQALATWQTSNSFFHTNGDDEIKETLYSTENCDGNTPPSLPPEQPTDYYDGDTQPFFPSEQLSLKYSPTPFNSSSPQNEKNNSPNNNNKNKKKTK